MTLDELKSDLWSILAIEEYAPPDWKAVEALSEHVIERLNTETEPAYPHGVVYHFLEDADARRKSERYAEGQRSALRAWLEHA